MKRISKISAGIITASLLAVQFVLPVQAASPDTVNHGQTVSKKAILNPSAQNKSVWDKSSLSFADTDVTSDGISATVKNKGAQMQGKVDYEVFWSAKGNPKNGKAIASGVVKALQPGESQQLSYAPDQLVPGNYMFKAYQRSGHPGKGVLWSSSITVNEANELVTPERPFDQFFNSTVDGGTATFTIPEGVGKVEISFTSYVYPDGVVPLEDGKPYENQTIYDNVTHVYGPGTYTVHVDLPENGYWQTDFYLGPVIERLTETGHPMDKIIDADFSLSN